MAEDRVVLLADVQNIYYTARQAYGCHVNYKQLWDRVTANRLVVAAFAYAIDRHDEKQSRFQQILRDIGFEVKLKPFIQRADGSAKGDWDVGITIDAIEFARGADIVVLASGDGDFAILVEKLCADYAVEVEVFGVPQATASSLMNAASRFYPIENELLLKSE